MDEAERERFVSEPHTAVLATVWSKGRAHAVPVWYTYQDGVFSIITGRGSQKQRNVERTGRATLCIDQRAGRFRHVTVEGPVSVRERVTPEERFELWRRYRGEEAAREITSREGDANMVMLVLTPERWMTYG